MFQNIIEIILNFKAKPLIMDVQEKKPVHSLAILCFSLISIILLITTEFGGFWLTGYAAGERFSCLSCEYGSFFDKVIIVLLILLLLAQGGISLNNVLEQKFIPQKFYTHGLILAASTIFLTFVGALSIVIEFWEYESWLETGFYAGLITGMVNFGLFFMLRKKVE